MTAHPAPAGGLATPDCSAPPDLGLLLQALVCVWEVVQGSSLKRPAELVGNRSAIRKYGEADSPFHGFDSTGVIQHVCGCAKVVCCP